MLKANLECELGRMRDSAHGLQAVQAVDHCKARLFMSPLTRNSEANWITIDNVSKHGVSFR